MMYRQSNFNCSKYTQQSGWVLPQVLAISGLILYYIGSSHEASATIEQLISADGNRAMSELLADAAIKTVENEINENTNRPKISGLNMVSAPKVDLTSFVIWNTTYPNYNLQVVDDPLIPERELNWWEQPTSWWEQHAHEIQVAMGNNTTRTAYVIVEFDGIDLTGSDLTQGQYYFQQAETFDFVVTVRSAETSGSQELLSLGYKNTFY